VNPLREGGASLPATSASRRVSDGPLRLGIVVAVRNEARWLGGLLTSLREQEGLESVCCIAAVDGRSEDDSREILRQWQSRLPMLRTLDNEARIAPVAFNIGIRECLKVGADAVLLVSGHGALHPGYFAGLQEVLTGTDAAIVGCVHDYPPAASAFEGASQAFAESRLGRRLGSFSRLTSPRETDIAFCPAIRREVFDRVGLFDETMVRNQDIDFTTRAQAAGFRIVTAPKLKTRYSPPTTFGRLLRQMYGNGVWVGRRLGAHGLRHLAPALFYGALLAAGTLALLWGGPWVWLFAGLAGLYLLAVVATTLAWLGKTGRGALWLPPVLLGAHGAYAIGTFRGLVSREEPSQAAPGRT
jgi:GT2 family glycosyltransferase